MSALSAYILKKITAAIPRITDTTPRITDTIPGQVPKAAAKKTKVRTTRKMEEMEKKTNLWH
jgi:hypothetical protein